MSRQAASDVVAARTRIFRKALRLSMRELAERSGLPEAAVEDIEIGRRRRGVTADELLALASALGCAPAALLPGPPSAPGTDEPEPLAERVAWLEGELWRLRSGMRGLLKGAVVPWPDAGIAPDGGQEPAAGDAASLDDLEPLPGTGGGPS